MAEYLRYVIKTIEPVRIADDSTSQSGQANTLRYIPGTTIRGLIINALAKEKDFEEIREALFSTKISYLNAYPMFGEKELVPSPKGFYENKVMVEGKKEIQNVVIAGEFKEGFKRAGLGRYAYIEKDCIYYQNVETGSDMKIKINLEAGEKQNVFRNEYIVPGQVFCGYIKINDGTLKDRIEHVFFEDSEKNHYRMFQVGNARSTGFGKCKILECCYVSKLPYEEYLPIEALQNSCYMMLLSNMAMRKETGELCGLDEKQLGNLFGVTDLKIEHCATSTVTVRGYNRIWQTKVPSVVMFEQGSVFHLKFQGTISLEKQNELCHNGIGIHKNEGCGRILFLKDYENVHYKLEASKADKTNVEDDETEKKVYQQEFYKNDRQKMDCASDGLKQAVCPRESYKNKNYVNGKTVQKGYEQEVCQKHKEDTEVLKLVAKQYYVMRLQKQIEQFIVEDKISYGTVSSSQLNQLYAIAGAYQYCPEEAKYAIKQYLDHASERESGSQIQKVRASFSELQRFVERLFSTEIEQTLGMTSKEVIMGIPKKELLTKEEQERWKLKLLVEWIRYQNKKGTKEWQ